MSSGRVCSSMPLTPRVMHFPLLAPVKVADVSTPLPLEGPLVYSNCHLALAHPQIKSIWHDAPVARRLLSPADPSTTSSASSSSSCSSSSSSSSSISDDDAAELYAGLGRDMIQALDMTQDAGSLFREGVTTRSAAPDVAHRVRWMMKHNELARRTGIDVQMRAISLSMFRKYWLPKSPFYKDMVGSTHHTDETNEAVCAAALVGALFYEGVTSGEDVHRCLELLATDPDPARLCAAHALLTHAGDKICKTKHAQFIVTMRDDLCAKTRSFPLLWDYESKEWIQVICWLLNQYLLAQTIKRERCIKAPGEPSRRNRRGRVSSRSSRSASSGYSSSTPPLTESSVAGDSVFS